MTGSDKHSLAVSNASRTRKMVARERAAEPNDVDVLETTVQAIVVVIAFIALLVLLSR